MLTKLSMKNDRIKHFANRTRERWRSLIVHLRRSGNGKKTSDFSFEGRPHVVRLRERTWHIEISRTRANLFFEHNRRSIAVVAGILVVAAIGFRVLIGFASTADFYPSSCLGNWENVENALGKPDLTPDAPASAFTSLNSALFATSTAQMFCGNFFGDTDVDSLTGKSFDGATLVLSWSFTFPTPPPVMIPVPGSDADETGGVASSTDADASSTAASSSSLSDDATTTDLSAAPTGTPATDTAPDVVDASATVSSTSPDAGTALADSSSTDIAASSTPDDTADASSSASSTDAAPPPPDEASSSMADAASSSTPPADTGNDASTSANTAQAPSSTPDDTSVSSSAPASDASGSDASAPTSWLRDFFGTAYADEASSAPAAASDTLAVDSSTAATASTSAPSNVVSSSEPDAISIDTSMFQNIILPSSTPDDILSIVYSTDGATWQPLVNITASNWQDKRYPIPIHSWEEFQHLQIAFVGLGASSSPQIYLDAAGVEVSYTDAPEATTDIEPASPDDTSSSDDISMPSDSSWTPPTAPLIQQPAVVPTDIFDQGAHQQCVVAPFSQTVTPGGSATFSLQLFSGLTTSSTRRSATSSTSAAPIVYQHPVYATQIGSTPVGVSAVINSGAAGDDVSTTQSISINVSPSSPAGSYSMLIVYRERQDDASMRSTGCQMNLVVK